MNVLAYADDIVPIGKNEIETRQLFVGIENIARKLGLHINQEKAKHVIVEWKNSSKRNKIGHYNKKIIHLGFIINEDNKHQIDLQERIKTANKTYFML